MSVSSERRLRVLTELVELGAFEDDGIGLCAASRAVIGVQGVGVLLMEGERSLGSMCSSDAVGTRLEELQFELGDGPAIEAQRSGAAVWASDLAGAETGRWLAFTDAAVRLGVRAIFGFPLRLGAIRFGALQLHHDQPGALDGHQSADAAILADIAVQTILLMQSGSAIDELPAGLQQGNEYRFVVHQAAGMVAVQLQVSIDQALVRIRAMAFARSRPVSDIAHDVVQRRLRFIDGDGAPLAGR